MTLKFEVSVTQDGIDWIADVRVAVVRGFVQHYREGGRPYLKDLVPKAEAALTPAATQPTPASREVRVQYVDAGKLPPMPYPLDEQPTPAADAGKPERRQVDEDRINTINALRKQRDEALDRLAVAEAALGTAKERIERARQALICEGYFKPHEVGDDIAPRIAEWLDAHKAELTRRRAVPAEVQNIADIIVRAYKENPLVVADICDEKLDRGGALLGYIRTLAAGEAAEHE